VPAATALALGVVAVAVLAVVDYATGSELSFSIFYLAPLAWVTWAAGRTRGLVLALLAAATWGAVDVEAGARYSSPWIPVWNSLVRFGFFAITAWLIADVRRAHAAERALARLDPLTGVANSRAFRELLDRELAVMRRAGTPLTIAYVDLDRFKSVNDMLGHGGGDELLRAIGARLAEGLRATDVVARVGGDEFALLLPRTDAASAEAVLERCMGGVRSAVASVPGVPDGVGATIGGVVFADPPASPDEAISAADEGMYEQKRKLRGHVYVARWLRASVAPSAGATADAARSSPEAQGRAPGGRPGA
jgi:diguanylate cyclase (GGDEF)-like protein